MKEPFCALVLGTDSLSAEGWRWCGHAELQPQRSAFGAVEGKVRRQVSHVMAVGFMPAVVSS